MCGIVLWVRGIRSLRCEVDGVLPEEAIRGFDDHDVSEDRPGNTTSNETCDGVSNDTSTDDTAPPGLEELWAGLEARGPDRQDLTQVQSGSGFQLWMGSSQLQLRGSRASTLPLRDEAGNVLLFNGEVFGGLEVAEGVNDGEVLLQRLGAAEGRETGIQAVLEAVEGPWAVVYWHAATDELWFGRDTIGRRSLLLHAPQQAGEPLVLTSVGPLEAGPGCGGEAAAEAVRANASWRWQELPPCVYRLQLSAKPADRASLTALPWMTPRCVQLQRYHRPPTLVHPPCASSPPGQAARGLVAAAAAVEEALARAVAVRCCSADALARGGEEAARVMLLFSGGVDSTLLAALAHRALPAGAGLDLVNVCFDGGRSPDRLAAQDALQELAATAPQRDWRLVEVDASLEEVDALKPHIQALLHPCCTVMDLNIGAALWLAARGCGRLRTPSGTAAAAADGSRAASSCNSPPYSSPARVVLLGHGADEQCCGYGRHRTKFREGGWTSLQQELQLDVRRLWRRNLGRDDRLVADHGRESRHPFLDERVMSLLLQLPLALLMDPDLPPGQGDKLVLREALRRVGLPRAAARPKRAIQFGSRIGKLSNVRDFGSNRKANLLNAGSLSAF